MCIQLNIESKSQNNKIRKVSKNSSDWKIRSKTGTVSR